MFFFSKDNEKLYILNPNIHKSIRELTHMNVEYSNGCWARDFQFFFFDSLSTFSNENLKKYIARAHSKEDRQETRRIWNIVTNKQNKKEWKSWYRHLCYPFQVSLPKQHQCRNRNISIYLSFNFIAANLMPIKSTHPYIPKRQHLLQFWQHL